MRVITGKYKGRRFEIPRTFKARPTTDFAKENLFNVLQGYLDFDEEPSALDLFSGTGSITLELLSRGCGHVVSVESDPLHFSFICSFVDKLKAKEAFPVRADVFRYLARCRECFDFIFADPPYDLPRFGEIPGLVLNSGMLHPGSVFIIEHSRDYDFSSMPHFSSHRVYGSVNFSIFEIPEEE